MSQKSYFYSNVDRRLFNMFKHLRNCPPRMCHRPFEMYTHCPLRSIKVKYIGWVGESMMSSSDLRKNATLPNHLLKWTVIYGFFTSVSRYNPSLVCLNPENLSVLTRVSVGEKLLFFYKHQCLHSEKYHPATKCFTNKN